MVSMILMHVYFPYLHECNRRSQKQPLKEAPEENASHILILSKRTEYKTDTLTLHGPRYLVIFGILRVKIIVYRRKKSVVDDTVFSLSASSSLNN